MKRLSILYLEDNDADVELVKSNLEADGIEFDLQRVETRAEFVAALKKGRFDIILTDYALPSFDGMSALELATEMCPEVPVIMISGAVGEEIAVEILKKGATDFVLKRRVDRLAPVVKRALKEAEEIRARRRAEEMIGDSEERLKILFESAPDAYYLSDLKGTFIDGNKAAEELLGYKREELIGRSFLKLNLLPLGELPRAARSLARNVLGLGTGPEEFNLIRRDGSAVPVEIRTHPVRIEGRTVVLGIARDMTERKEAQEEIHKLSQFRGSVIDNANVWLDVLDAEANVVVWNRAAEEISGYTREEVVGHDKIWEWLYPDEAYQNEIVAKATAIIGRGEVVEGFETTIQRKDGGTRIISWNSRNLIEEDGTVTGSIALGRDVTERKRAETALREERDLAESLVDTAQTIVLLLDTEGRIVHFNPYMEALSGYSLDEVQGEDWSSTFLPAEDQARIRELFQRAVGDVQTQGNVNPIVTKDGRMREIEWHDKALKDADGNVVGLLATGQDITERVQAAEERELLLARIHGQAQQLAEIMSTVPEGVLLLDAGGRVILANPVAEQDLATLADAKVGEFVTHLGDRPLAELLTSPPTKGLWHEVKADSRTFEVIARPMENGPEPENWVLVISDVTQERETQRRIQQQTRLAAVGQLAAGIAHDFNNIMAVIVLYVEMGLRLPDIPAQLRERLQVVGQQSRRATDLIQQILDFSRRAVLERRPMDLTPFLKEIVKLLERTVPENIKIEFTYGLGEYTVNADPTRMQQAVMNLVLNARDAMLTKGGGKLDIELDRVQVARHQKPPLPEMDAGDWVRIAVTDTGEGISDDVLPHMFEPFYTTKEVGKGTGLGLAQVYGIVKQHEGHIDVTTEVGAETTFTIYLPALLERRPEAQAIETRISVPGQGETILLVEDNAELRKAMAAALEQLNYRVLAAGDGREALAILEQHVGEVSLVLSDLVMPEMGGAALFHAMRQRGLTPPVVLLSGHPMEREMESLRAQGLAGWMLKPPNMAQLSQLLSRALKQ